MRVEGFTFGSIRIDDVTYRQDVVIDRGTIRNRRKAPSKPFRDTFGRTPLSVEEKIPWKCRRLVVGTGAHGALPVMDDVQQQAAERDVEQLIPDGRCDRDNEDATQDHQRDPARHLLTQQHVRDNGGAEGPFRGRTL